MWEYFPRKVIFGACGSFSHASAVLRVKCAQKVISIPVSPPERPRGAPPELLLGALTRLLRPLVRLLIQSSVTFPVLMDLLRALYVDVAAKDVLGGAKATTDSRISLVTGVHRKEVRRLRSPDAATAEPAVVTTTSQILARWLGGREYTDAMHRPRPLRRTGPAPSFESLVVSVTQDVRPRTILDDWLAQGIVALDADGTVSVQTSAFVPQQDQEAQLFYFARNLHDHIAAASANVTAVGPAAFLDRSVHYDGLSEAAAAELLAVGREAAQKLLMDVNRTALGIADADDATRAQATGATPTRRVNLGIYLYAADDRHDGQE